MKKKKMKTMAGDINFISLHSKDSNRSIVSPPNNPFAVNFTIFSLRSDEDYKLRPLIWN